MFSFLKISIEFTDLYWLTRKDIKLLRKLCDDGLSYRYPQADFKVRDRIEKELQLIEKKLCILFSD